MRRTEKKPNTKSSKAKPHGLAQNRQWKKARFFCIWLFFPALLYLTVFFLMQPHYLLQFSKNFFLDVGDGYQNVWNVWWVNRSVLGSTHNPYWTEMLQWPFGTTLVPQTMNAINGLVSIPLIRVFSFSLVQAVNTIVLLTYVGSGLTMFWFIHKLYGKYHVSLIAGGLFTFSSYHFAHGQGHLQLMTAQYLPLFLLLFWKLVERPRYRYAIISAIALFLVMLSDYYYLVWAVMLGSLWTIWNLYKKRLHPTKQNIKVFALFTAACLVLTGPLMYALSKLSKPGVLLGSHDPIAFSLDPMSVLIPGGSWVFRGLTEWHWGRLPYFAEMSVYFGYGLISLLLVALFGQLLHKKSFKNAPDWLTFWWFVLLLFALLALGPRLHLFGKHLLSLPLPYAALEHLWTTLKVSGMPVRWVFISLLAAIVIGSYVLTLIDTNQRKGKVLLGIFLVVSFLELWSIRLPIGESRVLPYVHALRNLPPGAVLDNGAVSQPQQLYNQTVHEKPMALGYVTRIQKKVEDNNLKIISTIEKKKYEDLCPVFKLRYITTPVERPIGTQFPQVYNDGKTIVYDLKNSDKCSDIKY